MDIHEHAKITNNIAELSEAAAYANQDKIEAMEYEHSLYRSQEEARHKDLKYENRGLKEKIDERDGVIGKLTEKLRAIRVTIDETAESSK